jgi:microcin C transport system substrate-binding protein
MLTLDYMDPTRVGRFPEFESNLRKLGVKYSERLVDYALFHRRTETFDFDLVIIVEPKFTLPDAGNIDSLYSSEHARKEGGSNLRGVQSPAVDALIKHIANASTIDELRTASRALDRVVMWNHWQIPMLYSRNENLSYWNKFGLPKVQANYMAADTMIEFYSQPWPLMTWWDKTLAPKP